MITVVFCTKEHNKAHIDHIIKSSGLHNHIEVIEIINNNDPTSTYFNGGQSLTKAYNQGLKEAKNNIVVFCHDDITIETKQWGNKLIKQFEKNPEFGIIGVAGSKNMPISGRWWEDPKQMYGRVQHTHDGKSWLSTYSEDLGQNLEEVVTVDGVFFAVDKRRIKAEFNETVEGFHFYDVTFSFENYLKGSKSGVSTLIRVNHQSIGQTNESWEENRVKFVDSYSEHLPANIKRTLRKGEKLKVLLACLSFTNYTGSELYILELAKELIKQNCEVSICSNIGNPLGKIANSLGIKTYSLQEPPGFKLGDGKWLVKTPQGDIPSQEKTLYKVNKTDFDILHLNHKPITEHILRLFPNIPTVCTIHSEVISLEEPVLSNQIQKYIAIRPEIKEKLTDVYNIEADKVEVIYNPIDVNKFKPVNSNAKREKKRILFVGTIDYLRREPIYDLIQTTKENNEELWIVGKKNDSYIDELMKGQDHVKYFEPTGQIEKFIQQCDETAGILLGRTTIEGWLCGKNGWIYDINSNGEILSKTYHEVPDNLDKFKSNLVVKEIMEIYKTVL